MKSKTLLFSMLVVLLFSCGTGSNNNEEVEEAADEEAPLETKVEPISESQLLAPETKDSKDLLIKELIRLREAESTEDVELKLKGSVYYSKEDFKILNFTEYHASDEYPFVLVINPATNKIEKLIENGDGAYSDISDFLSDNVAEKYAILPGNFEGKIEEGRDMYYNRGPRFFTPILLKDVHYFRTTVSGAESVWALSDVNNLTPLDIIAETEAEIGVCDGPIGELANITINDDFNIIKINKTQGETSTYDDCSTYTKKETIQTFYWDIDDKVFKKLPDMGRLANQLADGENVPNELILPFVYALNLQKFMDLGPWEDNPHYSWGFTIHKPSSSVTTVCASYYDYNSNEIDESRAIIFYWNLSSYSFVPQELVNPDGNEIEYIYSNYFNEIKSNSIIIYPESTYKVDFTKLQNERISEALNVEEKNDSIYILTAPKTLIYPSKVSKENNGPFYRFVSQLDKNRILLARLNYFEDGMSIGHLLINTSNGKQIEIPDINGNIYAFHFSPDKSRLALTYDDGGQDANYSPLGGVKVYDVSNENLQTIYEASTGYSGNAQIKWHSNTVLVYHNYCQNFFILGNPSELEGATSLEFEIQVGDYGISLYTEFEDIGYADYSIDAHHVPTQTVTDSYSLGGVSDNDYFVYKFKKSDAGEIIIFEERERNENGQSVTTQKEVQKLKIDTEGKFIKVK